MKMRNTSVSTVLCVCASLTLAFACGSQCAPALAADKPNVVIIFIDDMGYGDIGPFGSPRDTPHLDRMAKEGMKLTDFYVSSSACTPSRAALMTGCYADRIGMGTSVVFPADQRGLIAWCPPAIHPARRS